MSYPYLSRHRPALRLAAIAFTMITWLSAIGPAHATFPGINGELVVQAKPTALDPSVTIYFLDPDTGNQVKTPWHEGPNVRDPWLFNGGEIRFEPDGLRYVGLLNSWEQGGGGYALQSFADQHTRQRLNPANGGQFASPMLDGRFFSFV